MSITEEKKELRKRMLEKRSELRSSEKVVYDNRICAALAEIIKKNNYRVVHAYIPFMAEINITPLLQELLDSDIRVICPKTLPKRKLENRELKSLRELETGIMGTQHPANPDVYEGSMDMIIVPGLAFDASNYRLGYGGGYYDNFLVQHPEAYKVGIFYPFQLVDQVPVEAHDFKLDHILVDRFES